MFINLSIVFAFFFSVYITVGIIAGFIAFYSRTKQERRYIPENELNDFFSRIEYRIARSSSIYSITGRFVPVFKQVNSNSSCWKIKTDNAPTIREVDDLGLIFPFFPRYEVCGYGLISPFSKWTKFFNNLRKEEKIRLKREREKAIKTLYDL